MKHPLFLSAFYLIVPAVTLLEGAPATLTENELNAMKTAINEDPILARMVARHTERLGVDPAVLYEMYKTNIRTAELQFEHDQKQITPFSNLGSTKKFELLPLVDWFTSNDTLVGASGVAYLIRTDDATILFDLGQNWGNTDPSPLLINMAELNVCIDDIDAIVISHPHHDHLGGREWEKKRSFSLTNHQFDLGQKLVFTPVPMTYPGLNPIFTPTPSKIAKGVATIGVIHCPLFLRYG